MTLSARGQALLTSLLRRANLLEEEPSAAPPLPSPVEAVVFDFDGVFTDNRVIVTDDGHEAVVCNRGDGMGLELLRDSGIALWILSKERNPVVARRAEKLKLDYLQAIDDKPTALREWAVERNIDLERTIYVGNDINDVACMELVGFSACPADSHDSALEVADLVLRRAGGDGAVRELCDLVLAHQSR